MTEPRSDAMQTTTQPPADEPPNGLPPSPAPAEGRGEGEREGRPPPGDRGATERGASGEGHRQLPLRTRIILGTAGGILVVLGIAGLFLPFLQGILFLVLAAAVLSLTSRRVYRWLQGTVGDRWPQAWRRVERFRTRVRWKLRKR